VVNNYECYYLNESEYKVRKIQIFVILVCLALQAQAQLRVRENIHIPDILGYKTLKCDFHTHTVFSDGNVWPTIRVEEAWRNGLNAIAITDHIEYTPHKKDIPVAHNRSFEIAKPLADQLAITLIRGSEITRNMPPGHFNAIFLSNAEALETVEWREAMKNAHEQGAFIFWNHPGWRGQQSDGISRWYKEHTEILEKGWLQGIEVINENEYYPEAHQWCLDKKLTMLSNSDIHDPIGHAYDIASGELRPLTLVFASENSAAAIREALFDRRTAVLWDNILIGEEKYLRPLFENSIKIINPVIGWHGKQHQYVQIQNNSDISFALILTDTSAVVSVPEEITLYAGKTVLLEIRGKSDNLPGSGQIDLAYQVKNLKIDPGTGLPVLLRIILEETTEN
jgi:hypothetical protein